MPNLLFSMGKKKRRFFFKQRKTKGARMPRDM
jgi:hypothetical protein